MNVSKWGKHLTACNTAGCPGCMPHIAEPTPVHDAERERLKGKKWIQTYTGKQFFPLEPRPADVCIEDIAHALAMKCRYTGHCRTFYSVAEHCVRASRLVHPAFALPALLHDAAEAYLCDLAAPIKGSFYVAPSTLAEVKEPFRKTEDRVLDVIFEALGLSALRSVADSEQVKKVDLVMLSTEVRDLMAAPPDDWHLVEKPDDLKIKTWDWDTAEHVFLQRFGELTGAKP